MWYVNKNGNLIVVLLENCFILTMWYVNKDLRKLLNIDEESFILTMWYVNKSKLDRFNPCKKVLY